MGAGTGTAAAGPMLRPKEKWTSEKDMKMSIPFFRLSICNIKQEELNYALNCTLFFFASQHFCGKIGYNSDIFAFSCTKNSIQRTQLYNVLMNTLQCANEHLAFTGPCKISCLKHAAACFQI